MTEYTEQQKWDIKFFKGALKSLLRPHQLPIYDAIWKCINDRSPYHPSHYVNSSRQIGKSFVEVVVAVEFCIRYPKSTVIFVAPLRSQAEEIILGGTYFTIFDRCPARARPKLDGTTIVFPNGSRIRMGGTDNKRFEDLRGGAAHLLILDECAFMQHLDDGVLPALQPMLNTTGGKTIFSSTPAPTLEHPSTAIYRDHLERGAVSHFTIFDNTSLDEGDYIKAYTETGSKQVDGEWVPSTRFRREYLAEHVMEGEILIAQDWNEEFIRDIEPDEFSQFHHLYISMDPGVRDFNATVFGYYNHVDEHLHIQRTLILNGPTLNSDILSTEIKAIRDELWSKRKVYKHVADNNNPHLIQDLKMLYGLPFFGTSKTRLESTRAAYEEGMVTKLNTWFRRGKISIGTHPSNEHLIGCLRYGTWKEVSTDKREFAHSKTYGHFDALAALVYLVRNVDTVTNPIPPAYGHDISRSFIDPGLVKRPRNPSLGTLARALRPK